MTTFNIEIDSLPLPNGLNVDGSGNLKVVNEGTIEVDTTGLATSAKQDSAQTSLTSIDGKTPALVGGAIPVSAAALPLPSGAATGAKQDIASTSLASIDTKLTNPLPVSLSSIALPTGASTAARQDTGNTSLASIDTKLTNPLVTGSQRSPIIIQKANGVSSSGSSLAVAFSSPVAKGNTIVVAYGFGVNTGQTPTVTDSLGNVFIAATINNFTAGCTVGFMFGPVLQAGADTVTVTIANPFALAMEIWEVQGTGDLESSLVGSSAGSTTANAILVVNQENEIAFFAIGCTSATISAASPLSPASLQFDSGSLSTGGSVLQNFGAFSALLGSPIASTNANSGNITNTIKVALGSSVNNVWCSVVFRPSVLQVTGVVWPVGSALTLADGLTNGPSLPLSRGINGTSGNMFGISYGCLFNGTTWDRARSGGATGMAGVAGAAASGASKAGNPVQVGGVFNTTQPTVTTGQAVEVQATARGALIVAPGVDSFAVQATLAAETTKVIGTVRNLGNAGGIIDGATAASVPANAVQQGARAATAYPTAVTDGQLVAPMADKAGRQVVVANAVRDLVGTAAVSASAASGTSLIAAGGTGVFNDIVSLTITNESATATVVSLTDGTVTYKFAIAGNGGGHFSFPTPLPATSTATAWTVGNSATVALDYVVLFVKNK